MVAATPCLAANVLVGAVSTKNSVQELDGGNFNLMLLTRLLTVTNLL